MKSNKLLRDANTTSLKTSLIHFTVVLCLGVVHPALRAQIFEKVPGPVTSISSDSRSVNFFDLNQDGWEDIYISNGRKGGQADLLYLNKGHGNFTLVEDQEIVLAENPSDGASFADIDNDGHIDGVVSSWYGAEDLLYQNDGSGRLRYAAAAGIVSGSYAETATFGDYDQDGWPDLYITNSGDSKHNYLYRNRGNGKFERISDHPLIREQRLSRAAIWTDVNNDGYIDLFVANESDAPNELYLGRGAGFFEPMAFPGQMGSMTASWGDIDNDGDVDLFVGNSGYFKEQRNQLYRNLGDSFEEIQDDPASGFWGCTFGSAFGDFDNDGDLDLAIANGFCQGNMQNRLYENQGDGSFREVSDLLGDQLDICSFGIAWGDIDNDGFLDLLAANCRNNEQDSEKTNSLLRNLGNDYHWLKVRLTGVQSNVSALGARVRIKALIDGLPVWQMRELSSQSGYAGQSSMILHFGLKNASKVDSLVVEWPSGHRQVVENLQVNEQIHLVEHVLPGLLALKISPPGAASDSLKIEFQWAAANARADLQIIDTNGQQRWHTTAALPEGTSALTLPWSEIKLPPGIYHLILRVEEKELRRKFVVDSQ